MGKQKKVREERAQDCYDWVFDKDLLHLMDVAEGERQPNRRERARGIGDEYEARRRLQARSYGIEREVVYYVTVVGGGLVARLKVRVDDQGDVEEAVFQFVDWIERLTGRWTDAPRQDAELVARYARLVGFYQGAA